MNMKARILILSIFVLFLNCTKDEEPEVIYDGSINFTTQQQIDDFGMQGYTKILGNVIIGHLNGHTTSSISNLNGLIKLKFIDGVLIIQSITTLTDVNGLSNLSSIQYLGIVGNPNLLNIDGLENVSSDIESLTIWENNSLENINGLKNISVISGGIKLKDNPKLKDIDGFINLKSVVGKIEIQRSDVINLDGLINLSSPVESIDVSYNSKLNNLSGLNNIPSVETRLLIYENQILTNFCGVETIVKQIIEDNNKEENINSTPIQYHVSNNAYNPTKQDFIDDKCSQ